MSIMETKKEILTLSNALLDAARYLDPDSNAPAKEAVEIAETVLNRLQEMFDNGLLDY